MLFNNEESGLEAWWLTWTFAFCESWPLLTFNNGNKYHITLCTRLCTNATVTAQWYAEKHQLPYETISTCKFDTNMKKAALLHNILLQACDVGGTNCQIRKAIQQQPSIGEPMDNAGYQKQIVLALRCLYGGDWQRNGWTPDRQRKNAVRFTFLYCILYTRHKEPSWGYISFNGV